MVLFAEDASQSASTAEHEEAKATPKVVMAPEAAAAAAQDSEGSDDDEVTVEVWLTCVTMLLVFCLNW
jgi:hypothetical protein